MSGDAQLDYFADGLVEDITTALGRVKSIAVVARNSSFACKGHAVDVRTIGQELGADYLLEGSVRPSGERLRLSVQLINAKTGAHLWAGNFDNAEYEVMTVQDQIVAQVVMYTVQQILCAEVGGRGRACLGQRDLAGHATVADHEGVQRLWGCGADLLRGDRKQYRGCADGEENLVLGAGSGDGGPGDGGEQRDD